MVFSFPSSIEAESISDLAIGGSERERFCRYLSFLSYSIRHLKIDSSNLFFYCDFPTLFESISRPLSGLKLNALFRLLFLMLTVLCWLRPSEDRKLLNLSSLLYNGLVTQLVFLPSILDQSKPFDLWLSFMICRVSSSTSYKSISSFSSSSSFWYLFLKLMMSLLSRMLVN